MITRLVKLTLQPSRKEDFTNLFRDMQGSIKSFPGCSGVELFRDLKQTDIVFTYSTWDSVEALEAYRRSDLFRNTWEKAKAFFSKPAEAWSLVEN